MSAKVTWVDKGLAEIRLGVAGLAGVVGRVGVLGSDAERTHPLRKNISIGAVAQMNEYGSSRAGVPRRSYLQETLHEQRAKVVAGLAAAARAVIFNKVPGPVAIAAMVKTLVPDVVAKIMSGTVPPPNSPVTVERKGHDRTLQDTGTLAGAITSDVVRIGVAGEVEQIGEGG